jgi:hypothetical protein
MIKTKSKKIPLEPFVPTSNPKRPPTNIDLEIAYRWVTGEIRLRSAIKAIGYDGTPSNGLRYLCNVFIQGVRDGRIDAAFPSRLA